MYFKIDTEMYTPLFSYNPTNYFSIKLVQNQDLKQYEGCHVLTNLGHCNVNISGDSR